MVLVLLAALLLGACQAATPSETDCASTDVFCIGLVTGIEGIHDMSTNQAAWEGVQAAQNENVADQVRYIETVDLKDYEQNITSLAENGYDVIVSVGEQFTEATDRMAKTYPNTSFIGVDQNQVATTPNLTGLVFHADQGGFLAGALAAQLTRSGTIAGVFGSEMMPGMSGLKYGYEAGARYINPEIIIISPSPPEAKELTEADARWGASAASDALQNGADVVFGSGDRSGNAALIEGTHLPEAYCIGVGNDQWESLPDAHPCLVTSVVKMVGQGITELIKQTADGKLPAGNYYGSWGYAPYHDFESLIPQTTRDGLSQIADDLRMGSLTTGYDPGK
ncbi:MAG: BMP family ABC transporter substrate-binding protein [Anaerolineales bacterium]|nr:MAG: BMP family ABC transporter substrate-binding protein [Anaerolineales bacterium]